MLNHTVSCPRPEASRRRTKSQHGNAGIEQKLALITGESDYFQPESLYNIIVYRV